MSYIHLGRGTSLPVPDAGTDIGNTELEPESLIPKFDGFLPKEQRSSDRSSQCTGLCEAGGE